MAMTVLRVLSAIVNIYSFIILVYIILSWFPERDYHLTGLRKVLARLTTPYLRVFRRLRFLRIGRADLSPLAALVLLSAVQIMLAEWIRRGIKSLILFPVFLASTILNTLSLFSLLLCITILVRVLLIKVSGTSGFTAVLDRILQPMVLESFRFFRIKRSMSFVTQLLLLAGAMLLLCFGFRILSAWLFLL